MMPTGMSATAAPPRWRACSSADCSVESGVGWSVSADGNTCVVNDGCGTAGAGLALGLGGAIAASRHRLEVGRERSVHHRELLLRRVVEGAGGLDARGLLEREHVDLVGRVVGIPEVVEAQLGLLLVGTGVVAQVDVAGEPRRAALNVAVARESPLDGAGLRDTANGERGHAVRGAAAGGPRAGLDAIRRILDQLAPPVAQGDAYLHRSHALARRAPGEAIVEPTRHGIARLAIEPQVRAVLPPLVAVGPELALECVAVLVDPRAWPLGQVRLSRPEQEH